MKEIIFVTTNRGKIASAQRELKNIVVLAYNAELIEPRSEDIKEIAKQKVLQAYKIVEKPCISLDSGFFINELNGFPKAYVNHNRYCEFKSCLAYYDGVDMNFFESKSPGIISKSIQGKENENKWSDLWYIFKPENFNKTLAEFTEEDFIVYDNLKEDSCIKKFGTWYESKTTNKL